MFSLWRNMSRSTDAVHIAMTQGDLQPKAMSRGGQAADASMVASDIYLEVNNIRHNMAAEIAATFQSIRQMAAHATRKPLPPLKRYQTG